MGVYSSTGSPYSSILGNAGIRGETSIAYQRSRVQYQNKIEDASSFPCCRGYSYSV